MNHFRLISTQHALLHFWWWFSPSPHLDLPGDVAHVVAGEGAAGVEVVAAGALHAPDQLAHVGGEVVLGRTRRVQGRHTEKGRNG